MLWHAGILQQDLYFYIIPFRWLQVCVPVSSLTCFKFFGWQFRMIWANTSLWTKILCLEIATFELKMMVKIGLEFFILKFSEPLQSCYCPVQKNLPRKAELARQVSRYLWRGSVNFKIKNSRSFFIIISSQKCQFQDSRFLSTYRMSPSWCDVDRKAFTTLFPI